MGQDEPQKPIPRTDGKQMTLGHSYSTRSKVKRTPPSEYDSSGSQSHQPPPKKQTRSGAKQAGKSVEIINDDATPDSDPVDSNTVDEATSASAQTALQNRLVLETLFRYMNLSDLLSCRLVNKLWQYEATKELRRRKLVIRFLLQSQGNQESRSSAYWGIGRHLRKCRTPSLLSSFQVKIDSGIDLGSAGPTRIFTTVGNHLKNLTLHLNWYGKSKECSFERSSFMTHLQNLLFRQAPNLEFLEIKFDFPDRWRKELQALDSSGRLQNVNNENLLLPNLKTFIVSGSPPPNLFADVIKAAVNLSSVGIVWSAFLKTFVSACGTHVLRSVEFWSACIKYFMGPEGRQKIHLVKSLRFQLLVNSHAPWSSCDLELMETFLTEHKQNLKLETFEIVSEFHHKDASFAPRIVGVINQVLECSSGSLLKLRIEPAKWFDDLLIIPRLTELQEICFDCLRSSHEWLIAAGGFFPLGFNMNNSFPNVSTIVLSRCSVPLFLLFVSRMEIEMTEPIRSVRRIIIIHAKKDGSSVPPLASDFHHIFPNLLSVSYVNKGGYYKI